MTDAYPKQLEAINFITMCGLGINPMMTFTNLPFAWSLIDRQPDQS